jgi:hypothetical protein
VHVDRALLDEHVVAPYAVEQLRPAVHALRMRHEEVQQPELGRPERDLPPAAGHEPRRRIEPQAGDLDRVIGALGRPAPQHRLDAREQLLR